MIFRSRPADLWRDRDLWCGDVNTTVSTLSLSGRRHIPRRRVLSASVSLFISPSLARLSYNAYTEVNLSWYRVEAACTPTRHPLSAPYSSDRVGHAAGASSPSGSGRHAEEEGQRLAALRRLPDAAPVDSARTAHSLASVYIHGSRTHPPKAPARALN